MADDDLMPTAEDLDFHGVTSRYSELEGVVIDALKVPERFRHLVPLAKYWSIGDDVERADMMWLTRYEELKELVLAVRPFADEISIWCCTYHADVAVANEVILFQMLGRAVAEAEALHVDVES